MSTDPWLMTMPESLDNRTSESPNGILENKLIFSPMVLQNLQTPTVSEESPLRNPDFNLKLEKNITPERKRAQDDEYNPYC